MEPTAPEETRERRFATDHGKNDVVGRDGLPAVAPASVRHYVVPVPIRVTAVGHRQRDRAGRRVLIISLVERGRHRRLSPVAPLCASAFGSCSSIFSFFFLHSPVWGARTPACDSLPSPSRLSRPARWQYSSALSPPPTTSTFLPLKSFDQSRL